MTAVRPTIPSITEATRRVDAEEDRIAVSDEILSVTEDFASYVAERGFGITVATPARRRLRDQIERIVVEFLRTAEPPAALDKRAEARVEEIVRQALAQQVEVKVDGLSEEERQRLIDSIAKSPSRLETIPAPPPPPDRMIERH